ncbi:MAG: SDR family oxidoreductase [Nanoarchaeota archaeon]|nr:SDR family oxidoreductase [Nanoarchaeota archaeon]
MKYNNLKDKVVMVTGASSGLGKCLARAFIDNGCTVYMGARRADKLQRIASAFGEKAIAYPLDVTDRVGMRAAAYDIVREKRRIDIWVNNAGGEESLSLENITSEILEEITAVNYFGLVYGTQEAAKYMKHQKQGDIVQILSTSAFTPRANESIYCAAKAAASIFSESVQQELKQYGIRVFPIYPGGMNTEFAQKAGLQSPQNAMEPKDVADIILHALSQPRNITVVPRILRNG